jgi:hypothetical protein
VLLPEASSGGSGVAVHFNRLRDYLIVAGQNPKSVSQTQGAVANKTLGKAFKFVAGDQSLRVRSSYAICLISFRIKTTS